MTINGFEVDEFNIHNIPKDAKHHTCPKCSADRKKSEDKCMSVFWDTGLGQCNHCGERVQLHTYKASSRKSYFTPPPKTVFNIDNKIVEYFNGRGISTGTLNFAKLSSGVEYMPQRKKEVPVIEFNYYLHGDLINTKFRDGDKNFKFIKDAKVIPYGIDNIIGSKEVIWVEGEVDCLSWVEAGEYSVISVPNGFTLPKKDGGSTINLDYLDDFGELLEGVDKHIIATDNDTAGIHGKSELIRRLGADKCYEIDFAECKDSNEYLVKYGKEELKKLKETAKPIPISNVVSISDTWDKLKDFWVNGVDKGLTTGLEGMDAACSFAMSQYTLILSAPNSGKSDKVDDIISRLNIRYGLKAAFCSVENDTVLHQDKWFRRLYGRRPLSGEINKRSLEDYRDYISDNYFQVDGTKDLKSTLTTFRQLYRRYGVKLFVVDPFNRIRLKDSNRSDVNQYTEDYHLELDKFVKETDSHLFLVLHPTKIPHKEGSNKTYVMPNAYMAKGGGEHFDMTYNMLGMVRDHDLGCVQFKTLKWKYQHLGTSEKVWYEAWNINNGRYVDIPNYEGTEPFNNDMVNFDNRSWLEEEETQKPDPNDLINSFENQKSKNSLDGIVF